MVKYTQEILEDLVFNSSCIAEVVKGLGLKVTGSNHRHIKHRLLFYKIDISHFVKGGINTHNRGTLRRKPKDVLVISTRTRRTETSTLRRALLRSGIKEKCGCGQGTEWKGKFLRLQIDHVNGNGFDDRKKNLRFLCPNCHSQTETYGAKNIMA